MLIEPDQSVCRDRQADNGIIADRRFQGDVGSELHWPFIILFEEDGTHGAGLWRPRGGEDAEDLDVALDLAFNRPSGCCCAA